jgi:phosphoglycolate phosphatase
MITEDDVEFQKPDGRHVLTTIEAVNGNAADCVFIGDSETDMAAAENANIPAICVTYGYCHVPYAELNVKALLDNFSELPEALQNIEIAA